MSCDTKSSTSGLSTCSVHQCERWSNSISYTQLVLSSCIGITQLWWHPYSSDLRTLVPFMCIYLFFSVIIAYPLFYLELALGLVTRNGVVSCWDIAPLARGVSCTMVSASLFMALVASKVAAWCLAMFIHSFHWFLPWLDCPAVTKVACAARHRPLLGQSDTPAQSFFFEYLLNLQRDKYSGQGKLNVANAICYVVAWIFIYLICFKRLYSYSKIVLFKDTMTAFTVFCCLIAAFSLKGCFEMFHGCNWKALQRHEIWLDGMEFALIQMAVSRGTLVMLGSHGPKQKLCLHGTVLIAYAGSTITTLTCALLLGAVHGALYTDYDNYTNTMAGSSSSMVLWADLVARTAGNQFWAALLFFVMFLSAISTTALLIQTMMSTWAGSATRNIRWAILITMCLVLCLFGVILCTQADLHMMNYIMIWVTKPMTVVAATIPYIISFWYGQTRFCEDVFFASGEYPPVFLRVSWAIMPPILIIAFGVSVAWTVYKLQEEAILGGVLVAMSVAPIYLVWVAYLIFSCRVRNIVCQQ